MAGTVTQVIAGGAGRWRITGIVAVRGESLGAAEGLTVVEGVVPAPERAKIWRLRGVASNLRYATKAEQQVLAAASPPLARPEADCGALIPIRKTAAWWALAQDERRAILADRSRHVEIGSRYVPAIARRLLHCRDLGEPFDFLTWFEFNREHKSAFADLLGELRASEEWRFIDREVEVRLERG